MDLEIDDLKHARVIFNAMPLALSRKHALLYTGIADKLFTELEKSKSVKGMRIGRNGQLMYLVEDLRSAVNRLFRGYDEGPIEFD